MAKTIAASLLLGYRFLFRRKRSSSPTVRLWS